MEQASTIRYRSDAHVATIELHRPERANAIDPDTFAALGEAYHRAEHDDEVRVVVLTGAGADFSVGLDPQAFLPALQERLFSLDAPGRINPFGTSSRMSKPLIAAVQGTVGAMAHELILAADIRVAADDARFGQGEVSRGTTPAGCASVRMPLEVGWGNAMRWLLTAEDWPAEEALRLGLVQEVVPAGRQVERALELAAVIAAHPPLAVRETLRIARRAYEGAAHHVYGELLPAMYTLLGSADFAERLAAIKEEREPVYTGL